MAFQYLIYAMRKIKKNLSTAACKSLKEHCQRYRDLIYFSIIL